MYINGQILTVRLNVAHNYRNKLHSQKSSFYTKNKKKCKWRIRDESALWIEKCFQMSSVVFTHMLKAFLNSVSILFCTILDMKWVRADIVVSLNSVFVSTISTFQTAVIDKACYSRKVCSAIRTNSIYNCYTFKVWE